MGEKPVLGILGGSGLYAMQGLEGIEDRTVDTPFGTPSSPIVMGNLHGRRIAFIARHGIGHWLSPSEVNYRANIYALKMIGVERVVSVSACGSLREDFAPGDIVVPGQLYDNTKGRKRTFFEDGLVAHISVAQPFCPHLSGLIADGVKEAGGTVHRGGSYITIEGPRFSTVTESNTYRAWGMSIIGMTTSPEAFLAREAELCYGVMAHVTDYDVWHVSEESVSVELVIRTLKANAALAQQAISRLVTVLPESRECDCGNALEKAIITRPERIPKETRKRLALLVDRHLS
ncbi:MAG: S-methyl-5'-thioadenosine phosphorylase [Anaerolineales bacterium]|jgi:5'-methylthioadenosine phosphorylase